MDADTQIGGASGRFPPTRHSAIRGIGSPDAAERTRAWETIVAAYWKPAYKYIRLQWKASNEDAKDLTQGFFARALEKDFFRGYDSAQGSFRTYLRACLDGFVANERKAAQRLKRGGETALLPLDFETAEGELRQHEIPAGQSIEEFFHQEWVRSVFSLAVDSLRQECLQKGRQAAFEIFRRYDLEEPAAPPTYQQLAGEFGIAATAVTNSLAAMRRRFRQVVLETLRNLTANEREFRSEARAVLGIEV